MLLFPSGMLLGLFFSAGDLWGQIVCIVAADSCAYTRQVTNTAKIVSQDVEPVIMGIQSKFSQSLVIWR